MGGYFIGRPMDPEKRPAKTKKAKAESRVKSHGLGWAGLETSRPRPVWRRDPPERSPSTTRSSNLEGQDLEYDSVSKCDSVQIVSPGTRPPLYVGPWTLVEEAK